ncbi:MAG TPA: uridine phosphorylase [Epulopiscium sp.]|nr:uridine phosphorylase [Candidatus Epulonipiscium sp.]
MEKLYHIGLDNSHGAKYAILPGDPGRVEKIASYLDNAKYIGTNREYTTWLGEIEGEKVLVMSTGMGGPSTAIGVEELVMTGVETFIRIGTCGGMATKVIGGDLVIANGAIRAEGTSREYVPIEFPAISDFDVTSALVTGAKEIGKTFHTGVVQCKDSFYGQHDPNRMPVSYMLNNQWDAWIKAGCLASEMESSTLFAVASVLGVKAGCILSVVWNQEREKLGLENPHHHDTTDAIAATLAAIKVLIKGK